MIACTRKTLAFLALCALTLSACGGGGGGGANPPPPPPPPPPPSGGIVRTGVAIAVGEITGFGSIIVNGVRYDTTGTAFIRDDNPSQEDLFKLGHMVVIKGTIDDDNTNAKADTAEVEETVEAPATDVDTGLNTFRVLGQDVQYRLGETLIDDNCGTTSDISVLPGFAAVEVFGPYSDTGVIQATRIECKALVDDYEINGVVSNHDANAKTFNINALQVDYSVAAVNDFPTAGMINDGDPVEVKGGKDFTDGTPPVFRPTVKVEFKGNRFGENEGDHLEIEGFITDLATDPVSFKVIGITVTTDTNTTYEGGTAGQLVNNLKVEVEGEWTSENSILATKIEFKNAKNVRVAGLVDSFDGDLGTFVILGINVTTNELVTRFDDKTGEFDPFRVANMDVGNYVEARGQEPRAGEPGDLAALIVERDNKDITDTELRGFIDSGGVNQTGNTLTILGVTVDVSTAILRDSSGLPFANRDDFWAAVDVGTLIDVNGTETDVKAMRADEVKIEAEDSP